MKSILTKLQSDVGTNLADTSKTYAAGNATQKTVGGQLVTSPGLTHLIDVQTQQAVAPGLSIFNMSTNRKFVLSNTVTNTPTVLLYTFNTQTMQDVYIGKIILTLGLGTHAYRGFDVDDSDSNNIKIFLSSTVTTALCIGGQYKAWKVTLADFTIGGTTIFSATSTDQKGVYFDQYASQVGLNHVGTTAGGTACGIKLNTLANKTKFFMQNGAAATHQIYGFDHSLGLPSVAGTVTNGIDAQTTPFAGTSPSAYFRMGASQNGYSQTAPTAAQHEAVILQAGTNPIPTGFTASPANSVQTAYYMRDLQLVGGVWYFNLATTATGAAVVPGSTTSSFTMMRAFGISTSHSLFKTANLSAVAGTILQTNSMRAAVPTNVPANAALNGQDCLTYATSSNLYMGKVSDLADGSALWASRSDANALGTGLDIVAPTITFARYSTVLDRWIYVTNTSSFVMKPQQNNKIDRVFGGLVTFYLENQSPFPVAVQASLAGVVGIEIGGGCLFISGSVTGQRVIVACDVRSDALFNYSFVVSPIVKVPKNSILRFISTIESYFDFTDAMTFFVKSSNDENDTELQNDNNWIPVYQGEDNSPIALGEFARFKVQFNVATVGQNSPSQLNDLIITYEDPAELSDNWSGSAELSSRDGETPMKVAFRLKKAYDTLPTKFVIKHVKDDGSVDQYDTVAHAAQFKQTNNNGVSSVAWSNMGAFYNTALTTELILTVTSPSGLRGDWSITEG